MKRSGHRILTTHAGSLPRPANLLPLIQAKASGRPHDTQAYAAGVRRAVADIVRRQADLGLDIVDDGEMGKPGFIPYVNERLDGFEPDPEAAESPWKGSREVQAFPEFYEWFARAMPSPPVRSLHMVCTGPISYKGHGHVRADIENLKAALKGFEVEEAFIPSISPTAVEGWQKNRYYRSDEEYLYAIAEAMREEYHGIVDAGFLLQIDDPRLVTSYGSNPGMSLEEFLKWAELRVEVLNYALRDIPPEKVRFHTCYGINIGPRIHEVGLQDVVHLFLKINADAYSFEAANPRHDHEWRVWERVKLPEGKVLIPGVISHTTNLVEHPELVAQRLVNYANLVGRENVIAGSDCGFSSQATTEPEIHPTVVWAKFQAMTEGAHLATRQLWG
jgi:5-methyltetrahydropteroyltriglutamate--homocysteine methyltransferase